MEEGPTSIILGKLSYIYTSLLVMQLSFTYDIKTYHPLNVFFKLVHYAECTAGLMHGRKGAKVFIGEWPKIKIINFINLLHCHRIKKGDHMW